MTTPPDTATTPQTDDVQEPVATPTPDAQTAPAVQGSGPWTQDLQATFTDPEIASQVDGFLRTHVQPHVTKLEQDRAQATEAAQLYEDLSESPGQTYLAITQELFGDEAAQAVLETLQRGEAPPAAVTDAVQEYVDDAPERDPEVDEAVQAYQEQKRQTQWDSELERVQKAHPDLNIEDSLIAPFVVAADGDFDAAVPHYQEFLSQFQPVSNETTEDPAPQPPATLGGGTTGGAPTPPVQKQYASLDDAVDDFLSESRQSAPPVVGGV